MPDKRTYYRKGTDVASPKSVTVQLGYRIDRKTRDDFRKFCAAQPVPLPVGKTASVALAEYVRRHGQR